MNDINWKLINQMIHDLNWNTETKDRTHTDMTDTILKTGNKSIENWYDWQRW